MCAFQYSNFGSDLQSVDIAQTATPGAGQLVDLSLYLNELSVGGLTTGSFDGFVQETSTFVPASTSPVTSAVPATVYPSNTYNVTYGDFATTLLGCFDYSLDCVVTMRTLLFPHGEASCAFTGLTFGASFEFPLNVNLTVAPTSKASGYAYMDWFITGSTDAKSDLSQSVWAYSIDYNALSSAIVGGGMYNAREGFPQITSLPPTIAFDIQETESYRLTSGGFIGVAIQGSNGVGGLSGFGGYNVDTIDNYDFLMNCSLSYCYVGIQTGSSLSPIMELRGQLIAGVGTLLPSLVTLLCLLVATAF